VYLALFCKPSLKQSQAVSRECIHASASAIGGSEIDGLAIWQDANENGMSDRGEVQTLTEWHVTSLSCTYVWRDAVTYFINVTTIPYRCFFTVMAISR
jgi:hypothetical protein